MSYEWFPWKLVPSSENAFVLPTPPAEADGIFSVGAIGRSNAIARFSNTGPDCYAPGVDILSADHANRSGLKLLSGTSMATPHIAGAAVIHAQRLAQNGQFSARQLREEVLANVVPVSGLSRADAGREALRV
ncbi:S8 family serine peptidase [Planktotalea sp.]|uniref:S8 family serine peptidase n=1 Tax=Planktotalea sp. TaxID=2029877 RepID=UPI003299E549